MDVVGVVGVDVTVGVVCVGAAAGVERCTGAAGVEWWVGVVWWGAGVVLVEVWVGAWVGLSTYSLAAAVSWDEDGGGGVACPLCAGEATVELVDPAGAWA